MNLNQKNIKNFYWLNTGFLGDVILTSGAVKLAMKHWPEASHHLISNRIGSEALSNLGFRTRIVFDKSRNLGLYSEIKRIRKEVRSVVGQNLEHSVLIQCHRSYRSGLLAAGLGLKTVAYTESDFSIKPLAKVDRVGVFHESARIALLLEPLGIPREECVQAVPHLVSAKQPMEAWANEVLGFKNNGKVLVGIAPGSVWGTKRWPRESYEQLCQLILKNQQFQIILLGSSAESKDATSIEASVGNDRVINLAGKTSLSDLSWVYSNLDMLVCNDSSSIHYASGFSVPTIAIFGATIPQMGFGPLAKNSRVSEVDLDCRPCSDHGPTSCPLGHFKCMKTLSVDQVYEDFSQVVGEA